MILFDLEDPVCPYLKHLQQSEVSVLLEEADVLYFTSGQLRNILLL